MSLLRTRWATIGAAVAITLGAGGIGLVSATVTSGERPVLIPIEPCRVADTRPGTDNVGPKASPLGPGEIHTISAHGDNGDCTGIPTDAIALSLNVTALDATQLTYLTIWATGDDQPFSSSLNPSPGQPPTPNAVTTELSTNGQFDIFNESGTVNVIVDINGYYADHDHNDLYYTKRQADDRFVSARDGYARLTAYEMWPSEPGTNWAFDTGWTHEPASVSSECIRGRIDLPVGRDVTAMSIVYAAPAAQASISVVLSATLAAAGSTMTGLPPIALLNGTAPQTTPFEFAELPIPVTTPVEVLEDYSYVVSVCTSEVISVVGAEVSFA